MDRINRVKIWISSYHFAVLKSFHTLWFYYNFLLLFKHICQDKVQVKREEKQKQLSSPFGDALILFSAISYLQIDLQLILI